MPIVRWAGRGAAVLVKRSARFEEGLAPELLHNPFSDEEPSA
jgi:hypothetical protein